MLKRILVIDDEEDMCEIAKICLQITNTWDVLTATSGEEGLELAASTKPDAILLDAAMPRMDGLQTLKNLHANPKTSHIPVIMLTATVKVASQREYLEFGAKAVLIKPFDPGSLANQIEVVLGWAPAN
ncbi:response regulator [Alkalinema sp. FACHB-956]|uniref:response regulator n=1 Tax=Alkalinema sp. FACHB-956 TaxID=2692768 RepID=UPI0016863A99|nr:response regulator [Alkalinema sp. FACHB-956]MBD2326229.1 response regulator [Alkalinema sp. FACHB-956]